MSADFYRKKEAFAFEGFCNRLNCLASARLRWPEGFLFRWILNKHCPVSFGDFFNEFDEVEVTSDPGRWSEYQYADDEEWLCHYFLTTNRDRQAVKNVYEEILSHCRIEAKQVEDFGPESIALHYRKFIGWEKASIEECVKQVEKLANKTGVEKILVRSDHRETAMALGNFMNARGFTTAVLGSGSTMVEDFDRDCDRVFDFVQIWQLLTQSRWAVTNAISSTILDASRALGNEVWTFGNVGARTDNRCAFFTKFGFDQLVV